MIEQLNTIDSDDAEFSVSFIDSIRRYVGYDVRVSSLRNDRRPYWWRCTVTSEITNEDVTQHFFAPTYKQLKEQLIKFIAMYFNL